MNKKYSIICILLVIMLTFVFTSCDSNTDNNNQNDEVNEEVEDQENHEVNNDDVIDNEDVQEPEHDIVFEEKYDISYIGINTNQPDMSNYSYVQNHLEDKFNIELEFSPIGSEDKGNIDLLVTAGTLPDCGWVYSGVSADKPLNYYTSGAIRSIPEELIKECCPTIYELIENEPANRNLMIAPETEDELFCIYGFRYNYDQMGWTLLMRYDWMENLSLEPKGRLDPLYDVYYATDEAYTIDEFEDIIYEFTFSDPDMNNENDTMGFVTCNPKIQDHGYSATVMSAYGMSQYYNNDGTGWAVPTQYSPQAKKAYQKIYEWIQLGVIPQDLYSFGWNDYHSWWNSGKAGSSVSRISGVTSLNSSATLIENIPEVKLLCAPGLIDNDGTGGRTFAYEEFDFSPSLGFFFVSSEVQDEAKLKRILMLVDYMCFDGEGTVFCNYGEEGVHWEYNKIFNKAELDQSELPQDKKVLRKAFASPVASKATAASNPDLPQLTSVLFKYSIDNWPPAMTSYFIAPSALDINLDIDWYDRGNKSAKVQAENVFLKKVFTGESSFETEWDNFMGVLEECGYEGYLVEMNTHGWLDAEYRLGEFVHPVDLYPTHE